MLAIGFIDCLCLPRHRRAVHVSWSSETQMQQAGSQPYIFRGTEREFSEILDYLQPSRHILLRFTYGDMTLPLR